MIDSVLESIDVGEEYCIVWVYIDAVFELIIDERPLFGMSGKFEVVHVVIVMVRLLLLVVIVIGWFSVIRVLSTQPVWLNIDPSTSFALTGNQPTDSANATKIGIRVCTNIVLVVTWDD